VHARPTMTPPVAALSIAWTFYSLAEGMYVEAAVLAVALASVSGMMDRASPLYAWLTLPSLAVVSLTSGLEAGVETAGRIAVAALSASGALASLSYLEVYRWLRWVGLPEHWALSPALIARQAELAAALAGEASASLAGRGLAGWRAAYRLPIPMVVHIFRSSELLAEALYHRGVTGGGAGGAPRWRPTKLDAAVTLYIALAWGITLL